MGFLTGDDAPIIWRGPMLHGALQQFFREVRWVDLDYLIVDMPPGTGDVALSLSQTVPVAGAIVVTTPQQVSLADSRRAVAMYQKLNIPTLGIIENMSYFVCPNCHHEADIFGHGGGERMAAELGVPFLGRIADLSADSRGRRQRRAARGQRAGLAGGARVHGGGRADRRAGVDRQLRASHDSAHRGAMNIAFSKHTLANGLDVLLHEDHACPIVAVNLWYHVGSKNETPGHTGFAHLFEHLMFEGSQHHDKGYFQPLQGAGASLNGSTNADRTNYWEVVPSNALELALWMESDRMGFLLPALTEAKFSNQRDVVLNERRQNYENRPYGLAPMAMLAALFPPDHPYHWTTIGEIADLHAATLDEVREFFSTYYHPANASLAIAGDIDPDEALDLVRAYFEDLPPGPAGRAGAARGRHARRRDAAPARGSRRAAAALHLAWLTPAMFAAGDAELDLAADLLANGKTSRLYRRLVFEERIATDVSAAQNSREIAGFLQLAATAAAPGHTLAELGGRRSSRRSSGWRAEGPTDDEIERGRVQAEAQFMFRLQTVGGFGGKSDQLNAYNVFIGDPGVLRSRSRALSERHGGVAAAHRAPVSRPRGA